MDYRSIDRVYVTIGDGDGELLLGTEYIQLRPYGIERFMDLYHNIVADLIGDGTIEEY